MKPSEIADEIKREIIDDPTIDGATHVHVFAGKSGMWPFKKADIRLTGIVHSEGDSAKAEAHAKYAAGVIPVVNEIEVVPSK